MRPARRFGPATWSSTSATTSRSSIPSCRRCSRVRSEDLLTARPPERKEESAMQIHVGQPNENVSVGGAGSGDPWRVDPRTTQGLEKAKSDYDAFFNKLPGQISKTLEEKSAEEREETKKKHSGEIKELKTQAWNIGKLIFKKPRPEKKEREEILRSALVGLVGALLGEKNKGKELPEKLNELYEVLTDEEFKKDKEKQKEKIKEKLKELAAQVGGDGADDLAEQMIILAEVLWGDTTPEQRMEIFNTAVMGLLKRTIFSGYLDPIFLKAALKGYEFMKPFGDRMAKDLQVAVDARYKEQIMSAVERYEAMHPGTLETNLQAGTSVAISFEGSILFQKNEHALKRNGKVYISTTYKAYFNTQGEPVDLDMDGLTAPSPAADRAESGKTPEETAEAWGR